MEREEIEKAVREILTREHHGAKIPMGFPSNESLFLKGIVDSFGVFPFVKALEIRFKVKIKKRDIHPGTLETIENVTDFINKKKGGEAE